VGNKIAAMFNTSGASKCLELRKFFANTEYFYRERAFLHNSHD